MTASPNTNAPALSVDGLMTIYSGPFGITRAVRNVSFDLRRGEVLGVVGESGCGKTATALSIMRLLPRNAKSTRGSVRFEGRNLLHLREREMQKIRGRRIAMVFQDAATALNPVVRVGRQIAEALAVHVPDLSAPELRERVESALVSAGIPDPARVQHAYAHELSGGMCQRVMIAMGLICEPEVLIADEPTTALDVTVQKQILRLMRAILDRQSMSILFITHNPGVVAEMCDRVVVMYAGTIVEVADVEDFFHDARHPYTKNLLNSIPSVHPPRRVLPVAASSGAGHSPAAIHACPFIDRCPERISRCAEAAPSLVELRPGHLVACWKSVA